MGLNLAAIQSNSQHGTTLPGLTFLNKEPVTRNVTAYDTQRH